eukprot:scaffold235_cov160-Pinguiococcus_pyrenoidosus.AAC.3
MHMRVREGQEAVGWCGQLPEWHKPLMQKSALKVERAALYGLVPLSSIHGGRDDILLRHAFYVPRAFVLLPRLELIVENPCDDLKPRVSQNVQDGCSFHSRLRLLSSTIFIIPGHSCQVFGNRQVDSPLRCRNRYTQVLRCLIWRVVDHPIKIANADPIRPGVLQQRQSSLKEHCELAVHFWMGLAVDSINTPLDRHLANARHRKVRREPLMLGGLVAPAPHVEFWIFSRITMPFW